MLPASDLRSKSVLGLSDRVSSRGLGVKTERPGDPGILLGWPALKGIRWALGWAAKMAAAAAGLDEAMAS